MHRNMSFNRNSIISLWPTTAFIRFECHLEEDGSSRVRSWCGNVGRWENRSCHGSCDSVVYNVLVMWDCVRSDERCWKDGSTGNSEQGEDGDKLWKDENLMVIFVKDQKLESPYDFSEHCWLICWLVCCSWTDTIELIPSSVSPH